MMVSQVVQSPVAETIMPPFVPPEPCLHPPLVVVCSLELAHCHHQCQPHCEVLRFGG